MQTKKKVLIGGLSSLAVAAGVALTGGTSAYFYDLEMSKGNKIAACSLDLVAQEPTIQQTADGSPGGSPALTVVSVGPQAGGGTTGTGTPWEAPFVGGLYSVNIGGMEPGDEFTVTIPVDNEGECIGELWGDLRGPFNDLEGVEYEPEKNWQDQGNDPDKQGVADVESAAIIAQQPGAGLTPALIDQYDGGAGDLDNVVIVAYGPDDVNNQLTYGDNETFSEFAWRKPIMMDDSFAPSENTKDIVVKLKVPEGAAGEGNEIMGDSFEFLIDLALAQPGKLNAGNTSPGLPSLTAPDPAP